MDGKRALGSAHPEGELADSSQDRGVSGRGKAVDTFGGRVFVRWDPDAEVTAFAPVAYFLEFLKSNGLWQKWVADCPPVYSSGNAPPKADILGTLLLSVLAGHKRYAHVTTVRSDSVPPGLLGMKRVRSEDAVRRAFLKGEAAPYTHWLHIHLAATYSDILSEPWILDMDGTVKPLYGAQEQAVRGYNPAAVACVSNVFHRGDPHGAGRGSASGRPNGAPLCAAWAVGLVGPASARAMAASGAGRYRLGHGTHDGGVRAAGVAVSVQDPAGDESKASHRGAFRVRRLGADGKACRVSCNSPAGPDSGGSLYCGGSFGIHWRSRRLVLSYRASYPELWSYSKLATYMSTPY
jgi:hypothetical protein